ncbi:hypothetical protein AVEN_213423-1 [Araneus ventricosus]|uniref:Uncharacterized protein n=1 Tax=Araneus ventricosus TaxID=182803 RepID=A0A4Y2VZ14_ARAVE|nr:hypothetical protein AVEN_213423-1 [Araneus ventricosus]
MTQRLTYLLESTNSLNHRKHGFREGKSVDTAINELLSKIQTARRDGKHVLSIVIKGAFHNLQHRAILKSLDASACPININRLFHSLLQNRKVTLLKPKGRATKDKKHQTIDTIDSFKTIDWKNNCRLHRREEKYRYYR